MTPGILNFTIYQGATFRKVIRLQQESIPSEVVLTDCTVRMQVRATIASSDVLIELNESNGRAVITNEMEGEIALLISDEDTAALSFGSAVYDLELEYSDGTVDRLLSGRIKLSPEVTR